ncbi:unnamed protein product [Didymodactylos carnosus]|uniref:Uncharacterized protein n=1 Tax=Didymodactylos carnosus TaxID=1234261 RepID=A0A813YG37_9BILA|nr:unnamed protein product [Didymodactylos carnosus]CAF0883772.1 unnamed protein product [Didymodactylos carnosus]CAF3571484.1 unnamed protein product [Didymodactylos carnosus]CAF3669457.1 unnamed protein product [Didymodactylos carnosus]
MPTGRDRDWDWRKEFFGIGTGFQSYGTGLGSGRKAQSRRALHKRLSAIQFKFYCFEMYINNTVQKYIILIIIMAQQNDSSDNKQAVTPETLATAIKLAALSKQHEQKVTPEILAAALKLAAKPSTEDHSKSAVNNQEKESDQHVTPESLATAMKFASKVSTSPSNDQENAEITGALAAALRATTKFTGEEQESITPETLASAIKFAAKLKESE